MLRLRGPLPSLSLRSGETVSVSVVRSAGQGAWTVLLRGRMLTALSAVELRPGTVLAARVERSGTAIHLRLLSTDADLARMLSDARLPNDELAQEASRALLRSGLGVTAERLWRSREAARGGEEGLARRLRSAAEALRKLPDLGPDDLELLCRLMSGADESSSGGRRGRRERRRSRKRQADSESSVGSVEEVVRAGLWGDAKADGSLSGAAAATRGEPQSSRAVSLLRLFNHQRASEQSWLVMPCRFRAASGSEISGSVRVLFDSTSLRIRALVVGVSAERGPWWWFRLTPGAGPGELQDSECRVFCDSPEGAKVAGLELAALRGQLGKLGVRVADTVADGALFDGFSIVGPGDPRPVDLLG